MENCSDVTQIRPTTPQQQDQDGSTEFSAALANARSSETMDAETARETRRAQPSAPNNTTSTDGASDGQQSEPLSEGEIAQLKNGTEQQQLEALAKLAKTLANGKEVPIADVQKFLKEKGIKSPTLDKLVKSQEALNSLVKMVDTLNGEASAGEKISAVLDFAQKSAGMFSGKLGAFLKPALDKIDGGKDIVDGINTMCDPKASALDKTKAALGIAGGVQKMNALNGLQGKVGEFLKTYLAGAENAQEIVSSIGTLSDPNASAIDKAKAAFSIAKNLKQIGGLDAQAAKQLRGANPFMDMVSDALTLLDPNASAKDKATAAFDLSMRIPDIKNYAQEFGQLLQSQGLPNDQVELIKQAATSMAGEKVAGAVPPNVLMSLSADELQKVADLANDPKTGSSFLAAMKKLDDPAAAKAFMNSVADMGDEAARKALCDAVAASTDGVANKILGQTIDGKSGAKILEELASKLDAGGREALTKMMGSLDAEAMPTFLRLADKLSAGELNKGLPLLAKADGKLVGNFIKLADKALSKFGVQLTERVASKIFGTAFKLAPLVGAAPNIKDAYDLSKIAADPNVPPELRFFASSAAKLNGADAVLAIAEPFIDEFGVPIAASAAMASGELVMGLALDAEMSKAASQGSNYVAPDWLKTANVACALAQGAGGMAELLKTLGAEKFTDEITTAMRVGGKTGIKVAEWLGSAEAKNMQLQAHVVAQGLHFLADVIRNPEKYGELAESMAKDALNALDNLSKEAGALGRAALGELQGLTRDLAKLGQRGIDTLKWMAQHPGQTAELAKNTLVDMVVQGGQYAKAAYDGLVGLGEQGKEAVRQAVRDLVAFGKNVPDMLNYIVGKGGDFAKAAYDELQKLGPAAAEAVKQLAHDLAAGGKEALEMLQFMAEHPGQFGDELRKAAMQSIMTLARRADSVAKDAVKTLLELAKNGVPEAWNTVKALAEEGGEAAKHIAEMLKDSAFASLKEIWGGVTDLADALTPW